MHMRDGGRGVGLPPAFPGRWPGEWSQWILLTLTVCVKIGPYFEYVGSTTSSRNVVWPREMVSTERHPGHTSCRLRHSL